MFDIDKLELMAQMGGYEPKRNFGHRVTITDVHQLYAGLLDSQHPEAQSGMVAVGKLRQWLMHGDNQAPPVRGAAFARTDGELWLAYSSVESPAVVRGRYSHFDDFRRFLTATFLPEYDSSLGLKRTNPALSFDVRTDGAERVIVLRSVHGIVQVSSDDAVRMQAWLSILGKRDRRIVLCLPSAWTSHDGAHRTAA